MPYENDRVQSENDKFIADSSGEYISLNEFTSISDVPEDDLLAQETERLSSIIIDIEETNDLIAFSSGTSPGNKKNLSSMVKALIAICGAGAVGTFIYNLFNRSPQRMDFLSTLSPADRQQATDLIENITQFNAMNSSSAPEIMTTKETLLHLLIGSSIAKYPEELGATEKLTSAQLANNSIPYALSTPIATSLLATTKKPIVTADSRQTTSSPDTNEMFAPLLDKQEMEDIYQLEQKPHARHTRDANPHSVAAKPGSGYVGYTQAIKLLFLDKLSSENHAQYTNFLAPYSDDFFEHYFEFSKNRLSLPTLTVHLYNVFNKIFIKNFTSKSTSMNSEDFFVLHALLNLSQALKNKINPEYSNIKFINFWEDNKKEADIPSLYKYLNWMSPLPSRPLEENLYSEIIDIQGNLDDKIKSANSNNRINKIPKLIKLNTDTIAKIRSVLNERNGVKRSDMRSKPIIGINKVSGQSSEFLLKTQKELQMENNHLNAELRNLEKHSKLTKNTYPSDKIEELQKTKSHLDLIYHSRFQKEKAQNNNPTYNIHAHMAELIPSMILEICVNHDLPSPLDNTTYLPFEFNENTIDFAKQYFYSIHRDLIYYDYALSMIKQQPSMLSTIRKNKQNNHVDIYTARQSAINLLEPIVKKDFSLSSSESSAKLVDLLMNDDDYYSRLYLIIAATLYRHITRGQLASSPEDFNIQRIIDIYLQESYDLNKINNLRKEPDNFTSLSELKSNLHFESQIEYNKQFSDYKSQSSIFEAETIARNLINSATIHNLKGIQNIESLYSSPIQAIRYRFTSAPGGLTLLQFADDNWLVISSYNGNFVAKTFTDTGMGSSDAMFAILKKPREMQGSKMDTSGFRTDSDGYVIPDRFYPNINNKNKSEQNKIDAFLSRLHNTKIKDAAVTTNPRKDISRSTKTSSYDIIIKNLDQDLQSHAEALKKTLDYSGLLHKIATYIVPFYDVIYKSATDEEYQLNADDIVSIVFDAVDIVITVVSAGISLSASISKAITESTVRLSKSGLTKQALKKAVLKDLITSKVISKNAFSALAHFADDIINPVPYQGIHHLFKKPAALNLSKQFKSAGQDTPLADFILRGGGDFSFGLRSSFVDTMTWNEFKVPKPRDLVKSDNTGKFKNVYSLKNNPEQLFIKNKSNYFPVKYDDVFDTWRVQSPSHLDSYQHSFPIERQGEKWIPAQHVNLSTPSQKHHIKNNDVFTDEATKRLGENSVSKATIKDELHQTTGSDKNFLYFNDDMDMYIKNNNEYYDFEYLAPDQDVAFIGKRGEKRLAVIYNRNKQKFDIINSYWDDGSEVITKGSQGNISKTLSYDKDTRLYTLKTDSEDIFLEYDEMRNALKKSYVTGVTRLEGNVWRKEYDDFFIYEGGSTNSRLVIDGHGGETDTYLTSEFNIPAGSQVNFYAPHGKLLLASEDALEDFVKNKYEYAQSLTSGQKSPDYTLTFFEDSVSFREIAQRNKANVLQIKSGHSVQLSEVMHKITQTTGRSYTQFDIAVCRPRSGLGSLLPSGIYEARKKN
ncbi:hypothetical protein EDF81_0756 [Enterobacter sp. BIGb0383]|uniref:putative adhesin n=1 Tax=unclassified Enterobacter TaxID=2608935 RepID=UPI000F48CE03|nr:MULTISPECIES: hypothetical protein [unclassified Enterobacter]ROP62272.1 hypothetical protein EDF81_0756 [Enterobacter sp. BIGb0383]ROS12433.1 hypothetical protein EC848_0758 [Enterobacter sp. BIGb0359]